MTVNLGDWKLKLIQDIMQLRNEQSLKKIEKEIESLTKIEKEQETQSDKFKKAVKPIRKSISIDEMIKVQAYKPIEKNTFYKKVSALKIEEPLDELLAMLD